jgi:hypothetical protein
LRFIDIFDVSDRGFLIFIEIPEILYLRFEIGNLIKINFVSKIDVRIDKMYFLIKIITFFIQYSAEDGTPYRILIIAIINDPIDDLIIKFYDNYKIVFFKNREIVIIRYYFLLIENKIYMKSARDKHGKISNI